MTARLPAIRMVVICAVFGISGCATGVPTGAPAVTDFNRFAELVSTLDVQVNGSTPQVEAGQRLVYLRFQGPIVTCMAEHGFSYTPPPMEPYLPSPPTNLPEWNDALTPAPQTFGFDDSIAQYAQWRAAQGFGGFSDAAPNPGFTGLAGDQQGDYDAQLEACLPEDDTYGRSGAPQGAEQVALREALAAVVDSALTPDVVAALGSYPGCMAAAGYAVDSRDALRARLQADYSTFFEAHGLDGASTEAAAWSALVRSEAAAVAADGSCRASAHALAVSVVLPRLEEFAQTHAADLASSADAWEALVGEADATWAASSWTDRDR